MNRNALVLHISLLGAILAFSAAAGTASMIWKPTKVESSSSGAKNVRRASDDNEDDEEDTSEKSYKNGTVTGRLVDAITGDPVDGAIITVMQTRFGPPSRNHRRDPAPPPPPPDAAPAKSGKDGCFSINVPPTTGETTLLASHDRFRDLRFKVAFDGTHDAGDLAMPRNARLLGKLQLPPGVARPKVMMASIVKKGLLGVETQHRMQSVDGDEFTVPLSAGRWIATVYGGDLTSDETSLTISGDRDLEQTFSLHVRDGADGDAPPSRK